MSGWAKSKSREATVDDKRAKSGGPRSVQRQLMIAAVATSTLVVIVVIWSMVQQLLEGPSTTLVGNATVTNTAPEVVAPPMNDSLATDEEESRSIELENEQDEIGIPPEGVEEMVSEMMEEAVDDLEDDEDDIEDVDSSSFVEEEEEEADADAEEDE